MDIRPKQLLVMAALAGGLAFGGATLASAQTSDDGTTDTTVPADDGTTTDDGTTADNAAPDEDCPLHDGTAPAATDDATASATSS